MTDLIEDINSQSGKLEELILKLGNKKSKELIRIRKGKLYSWATN